MIRRYRVRGIYEMKYLVEVDEEIEAESEDEAIELVQDNTSAGQAYDQECKWTDCGPEISTFDEEDINA